MSLESAVRLTTVSGADGQGTRPRGPDDTAARGQGLPVFLALVILCAAVPRGVAGQSLSDSCEEAPELGVGTFTGDTAVTTNDGAAGCGTSSSSPDAWFRYRAEEECFLLVETCGSSFDTVLSVHSACPGTVANQVLCNDDSCGLQSALILITEPPTDYWIRVAGFDGAVGRFTLEVSCLELPEGNGPDPVIRDMTNMEQTARLGDEIACAWESQICNKGNEHLDWFGNPNPNHPFMAFNLYRLEADRFEQIGQSWAKHAFAASQEEGCGTPCIKAPGTNQLGIGCMDIYSTGVNSMQDIMGPRHEINPWTGEFTFEGSHIGNERGNPRHDALDHRLRVSDADLDPAQHPDARYFVEMYVVSSQDSDHMNSIGWEPLVIEGRPGGVWSFDVDSVPPTLGPALDAWEGATQTVIPQEPVGDGRCLLAAATRSNGDGTWRYEYALYNHDLDREVGSFTVSIAPSTTVSNVGFHAVPSYGEGHSNDPWEWERDGDSVTWSTPDNPVRWGTTYNFRFDADAPPGPRTATLGLFKPGVPESRSGRTVGPAVLFKRGDANADGEVNLSDPVALLGFLFLGADGAPCFDAADGDDSGDLSLTDAIYVLLWLFMGGAEPPAPGPQECGVDSTPAEAPFPDCAYDEQRC